jgi:AraC-like DNA-binding protein
MKTPLSTVSTRLVNNFLNGISIDAATRDGFVQLAGIVPALLEQPGARITEEQFATLYRLLATHLDDEMPGLFSRPLRSGTTKFLCMCLLDAPYLQTALHRYARFHRMLVDDFSYELRREPQITRFAIIPNPKSGARLSAFAQQLMLKFVHSFASWLLGRTVPVTRLHFAFEPPADASEYLYLYPGPVFFNQPESALYFPSALMDAPLAHRTKPDVRAFLAKAPQGWIFASLSPPTISHRVREFLESHFQAPNDIDAVAQALHFSVRTLCRRLEAEGTSFRLIKDALRRDIAVQRLTQTSRSIAAIAFELGFEDATAFHRAFKQWTGSTPGAYRRSPNDTQAMAGSLKMSLEKNGEGVYLPI